MIGLRNDVQFISILMTHSIPPEFWQGVEQFNQGQFYDCHDTLEALWMEAMEPDKSFYQGVLQIAVALYHLSNQNARGAMILLGEGLNRLRRYQPAYSGIDVSELVEDSAEMLTVLHQASADRLAEMAKQVQALAQPELAADRSEQRFTVPRILLVPEP